MTRTQLLPRSLRYLPPLACTQGPARDPNHIGIKQAAENQPVVDATAPSHAHSERNTLSVVGCQNMDDAWYDSNNKSTTEIALLCEDLPYQAAARLRVGYTNPASQPRTWQCRLLKTLWNLRCRQQREQRKKNESSCF